MTREDLEVIVRGYTDAIRDSLRDLVGQAGGEPVGFCVMLFDFGERGSFAYGSNANRGDVVNLLEEAIAKLRPPDTIA